MLIDGWRRVPRGVVVLGFVSLLMDASSELVHALLPLFMVTVLGASTLVVGVIEGIAEATAMVVKVFSGYLSDLTRRRKPLVLLGYGLGALSKLAFPLAPSLGWVVGARVADRIGKGIRGAPRDALIADLAPADARGASFGLRQALDTRRRDRGPTARARRDGVVRRRLSRGVLGRGASGGAVRAADHARRRGAGARAGCAVRAADHARRRATPGPALRDRHRHRACC